MVEVVTNPENISVQQEALSSQVNSPMQENLLKQRRPLFIWISLIMIIILICISILFFMLFISKQHGGANTVTTPNTSNAGIPTPVTTDLVPALPTNLKTILIIQSDDSSYQRVIVPTTQVNAYIKNLPKGERFISQAPDK